jgi:hypothetical protein
MGRLTCCTPLTKIDQVVSVHVIQLDKVVLAKLRGSTD